MGSGPGLSPDVADLSPVERVETVLAGPDRAGEPPPQPEGTPSVLAGSILTPLPVEVHDLDWIRARGMVDPPAIRARLAAAVAGMEALLDRPEGPGLLFDADRADPTDRAIRVSEESAAGPIWMIGDLHGDLLALEAALALIGREAERDAVPPRILFLGDFFDDEGFGLEVLVRVFEVVLAAPERACVIAGNHDEALTFDGVRFAASVSPSDFSEFLNASLDDEWIKRAGKVAVRFFGLAPRALFFPDGLLVAHAGFPLTDVQPRLLEGGDWNDPGCLADFVWTRAHPTARRKLPNRFSRGSQFGSADFADFCKVSTQLGRPITHMSRGHDHVEERWKVYPAYEPHPVLTTVALSRRLPRESFGPYTRIPTIARLVPRSLPQVFRLHIPPDMIREVYPEPDADPGMAEGVQL